MSKVTAYNINGSGGAYVSIPATIPCRRMEIMEDNAGTGPQGLTATFPGDSFTQVYTYATGEEPIIIGNTESQGGGRGPVLGWPAQNAANGTAAFNYRAADTLVKLRSATATATLVRVVEHE